jgi:hypothetical protein
MIVLDGTSGITAQAIDLITPLVVSDGGTGGTVGGVIPIQPITASVGASALTCTLNPTILNFRNTPLTSGTINTRTVATAISLVVPSTATLGCLSSSAQYTTDRLILIALDNAGTVELAVVNLAGDNNLDETTLISTTAIIAGSNSASVVYSTTARASLPFRVVGQITLPAQATAGTWATAPSAIQGQGGQALASMSSLGYGQTWQTVTRVSGTVYYNTTGKPILFNVSQYYAAVSAIGATMVINGGAGIIYAYSYSGASPSLMAGSILIPAGASYASTLVVNGGTVTYSELR